LSFYLIFFIIIIFIIIIILYINTYICNMVEESIHGKNDFAKGSKILLDTDLKIIVLAHQNNFVEILKIMNNAAKVLIF